MYKLLTVLLLSTLLFSCSKDNNPVDDKTLAPLSIEFDNIVGGQNLILGNEVKYTNSSNEQFTIDNIKYFISNIKLGKADGSTYTVPQDSSYFLITEEEDEAELNVPQGDYTSLTFTLGVDSLRSTMGIEDRKGALDPSGGMDGMYWGWNSGYIFFKMEGLSDKAPEDPSGQHKFRYHIGGFGGYSAPTFNNIKTITLDLSAGGIAKVRTGRGSNIHLMVDLAKLFTGTNTISIEANPTVMFSEFSVNVANNLPGMFRHDHTEN
jgi:hypothetical protein